MATTAAARKKTATPRQISRQALAKRVIGDDSKKTRPASIPAFDSLRNLVAALGTERDKRSHTHYSFPLTLTRVELENMFRSSWLAKRIVWTPIKDMTRAWVDRTWDGWDEPGDTSAKQLKVAEKKFAVRQKVTEAGAWGRMYGGAVIVIDVKGQEDWSEPLDLKKIKQGDLRALHVFDRWRFAATGELDYDRGSPNYGLPKFYTLSDIGDPRYRVHWSRVVRFYGEPLPWFLLAQNAWWPDSVLQHIAETIRDYDATMAGIASLVYEANVDIVESPGLADALAAGGGEAQKVIDRYAFAGQLKSINHMWLLDGGPTGSTNDVKGEKYTQKTTQFSGLKDVAEKFMINVSGAADIPMTRLFGQSPAGLSATGESDTRNYYDRLSSDQETVLRPALEYLDEVLFRHVLGRMPDDYELTFRPLWQLTDKEKAEVEKLRAERDQIYLVQGVVFEHVVAGDLLDLNTYRSMSKKDVELIKRLSASAPAQPMVGRPGQPAEKRAPTAGAPTVPGAGNEAGGAPARPAPAPVESATDRATTGDYVVKEGERWYVLSKTGKKLGKAGFETKAEAVERLRQIEYWKAHKK